MRWHDLLFAHWPVPVEAFRGVIPASVPINTFDGSAWLGIVPFRMSRVRPFGLPLPRDAFAYAEINVRTYVTVDGKPGVWFLSLDGAHRLAAFAARVGFGVPYRNAHVRAVAEGDGIAFESRHGTARPALFRGRYRPTSEARTARAGTFDDFVTNRLSLYAPRRGGGVQRVDVEHEPWPLQDAEAEIQLDTMAASHGISLPDVEPRLLFARRLDVVAHRPVRVDAP
jgi:uncharacterized protein